MTGKLKWSPLVTLMNAVAVTTGSNSAFVDLATPGYYGVHVTVDVDFAPALTDNLIVVVQASLDGTNPDDTSYKKIVLDKFTDPNQISFMVKGVAYFRLRCYRDGSTDTITVTAKYRAWNPVAH